jgi:hypothetical protein
MERMKNMKLNHGNLIRANAPFGNSLKRACAKSCQKVLAQLARIKEAIFNEAQQPLEIQEHLLRLALNEAEAVAWQTGYPHLLFPALAAEKVQSVAAWNAAQQSVRRTNPAFALAA